MKRVVMALGAAVVLSSVGGMSEAKTNRSDSAQRDSLTSSGGVSLPILYGVMGAVMLGTLGGMTYMFVKPAK
ncbi:hypothetical protein C1752_02070 [Acaryochloris thomasi RCC1774]|uniref:Uncharacterized protein n=1 Tax=Acaryochloris thomasi RCC1774 TaxID=1764569 RepID=A0A2W1JSS7_9CYAN|nr:hypothetical protein [Acaryochloris thomasi]PZD73672.1 hypothetical protein C1752_02070 [Acaryochloris thomasi RCC1774]